MRLGGKMHVRLPADLAGRVTARAAAEKRSAAQMTAVLVEQGLRALGETGDVGAAMTFPASAAGAHPRPVSPSVPTSAEIEAARTPDGGWDRETLAGWGVPWPPPKGWQTALTERGDSRVAPAPRSVSAGKGTRAAARRSESCPHRVRAGAYCKRCEKTV